MVVIARRVSVPSLTDTVVSHFGIHGIHPVPVGAILLLLGISQSIEAHILQVSRTLGNGEGIGLGSLHGNLSPLGGGVRVGTVYRHTALIELLSVVQDVLRYLSKVEVEVARIV